MIVFLNGASSSGKTTLARALQSAWPRPLVYWSLDGVISQLPLRYTGDGLDSAEGFPLVAQEGGFEVGIGAVGLQLNRLSANYIRTISEQNLDVVADFVLLNEDVFAPYKQELADQPLTFVGVHCEPRELSRRNSARADRAAGLAALQQKTVHFCRASYDLEVSSSRDEPAEMAQEVISYIAHNPSSDGFRQY